ncbi:alanine racemase [Homoserinibacter sp. YIM 151385]|uniref:alanine racemase n=1 Tax=Homoserinibacter sp. YIM 151385 TaxID=2985506 RepID=UPI0022F07098|nr:alanine racemase [Homoserinibacter sp. YIM 151385]WBU38054.1 alanine racemase [Homoserinibacter sp. YIM 151385]
MSAIPLPAPAPGAPEPWRHPETWWPRLTAATAELDPPLAAVELDALAWNAHDLLRRAGGVPIRVASKSVRSRAVVDAVLALPGFRGILAYTLPEALWLAESAEDVVVGYPSADRAAIARLAAEARLAARVTIMIDDAAQLDLVDAVAPPARRAPIRVALELDASYRSPVLGHVGVRRSPLHEPASLLALAREIVRRPGFELVGLMAYEAQIAGVGDAGGLGAAPIRAMQRASAGELRERRGEAVARLRELADLEFVNGGGTGSLESTAADPSVTELAAGSGLLGPHLFDTYRGFQPAPAAAFALPVVRRPTADIATVLGGGWIASGPAGDDRLPRPVWPEGLRMLPREGAGEVQTPLRGAAARDLVVGDRVWFRHTKAGELSEHVAAFVLVRDGALVGEVPSYRGEGRAFL